MNGVPGGDQGGDQGSRAPDALPAFDAAGQGPVLVVLLHGIGGGRRVWGAEGSDTVAALAAAGFRAIAIDFPGYADSAAIGPPTLDRLVAAVLAVVAHEQRSQRPPRATVLLGHSMGGMVAQELAARHAGAVQGLVLACTSALFGKPDGVWQAQFIAERLAPLEAGLGMAGMAAQLVPGLVAPGADERARRIATETMARVPEASYRAALATIAGFDRRAALADITVPTLLLAAEHDRTAPPEVMQRMAARVRGAEYRCLAGAGHIANLETPAAFNAAVIDFLQRQILPSVHPHIAP